MPESGRFSFRGRRAISAAEPTRGRRLTGSIKHGRTPDPRRGDYGRELTRRLPGWRQPRTTGRSRSRIRRGSWTFTVRHRATSWCSSAVPPARTAAGPARPAADQNGGLAALLMGRQGRRHSAAHRSCRSAGVGGDVDGAIEARRELLAAPALTSLSSTWGARASRIGAGTDLPSTPANRTANDKARAAVERLQRKVVVACIRRSVA